MESAGRRPSDPAGGWAGQSGNLEWLMMERPVESFVASVRV